MAPLAVPPLFHRFKDDIIQYPQVPIADVHVHLLGSSSTNGCYLSKRFQKSFAVQFSRLFTDLGQGDTPEAQDRAYVDRIFKLVSELPENWRGILLPMDGIYDSSGELDLNSTLFLIPNDYVLSVAAGSRKLVPASSVNPHRKDAIDELQRVGALGAVVVKWIPNTMGIDPSDKTIRPFYRKMKELNLTLLSHTGTEYAVGGAVDQTLGNPQLLRLPLNEGLNIIAAHCASGGGDSNGSYFNQFLGMVDDFPNLYGDISGLSMLHKVSSLKHLIRNPHYFDKLCYGSDFPLYYTPATSPFYFLGLLSISAAMALEKVPNNLERDIATLTTMSVPEQFFSRGYDVVTRLKAEG
ncbi:MAG: amidohydrolase family protein [Candidatus Neomarinimicrobiota bacterium]|nr:amidohydrolase family protein [Candidatus Neomarinimicrobiota bacterium]